MAHLDIEMPNPLSQWIEAQIAAGEYDSTSDYLCHLVAQDQQHQQQKINPDARFQSLFDRVGVKNRAEFYQRANERALALRNHPGEIETQAFLDSFDEEE